VLCALSSGCTWWACLAGLRDATNEVVTASLIKARLRSSESPTEPRERIVENIDSLCWVCRPSQERYVTPDHEFREYLGRHDHITVSFSCCDQFFFIMSRCLTFHCETCWKYLWHPRLARVVDLTRRPLYPGYVMCQCMTYVLMEFYSRIFPNARNALLHVQNRVISWCIRCLVSRSRGDHHDRRLGLARMAYIESYPPFAPDKYGKGATGRGSDQGCLRYTCTCAWVFRYLCGYLLNPVYQAKPYCAVFFIEITLPKLVHFLWQACACFLERLILAGVDVGVRDSDRHRLREIFGMVLLSLTRSRDIWHV